ncbi:MAG: phosphatidylserine decarboxylase [Polyangiaceae bacterium]|nr:phosphatidylserine decarboxylase [Polyangiaceae bacterium]
MPPIEDAVRRATELAARFLAVMPRVAISHLLGKVGEVRLSPVVSRATVSSYCAFWGVALEEAEPSEQPYPTLDALFTRHLRSGARPLAEAALVSPADGELQSAGAIVGGTLVIKGSEYHVAELTGLDEDGDRYRGGTYVVVYLSPRDYHRVHAPVDGLIGSVSGIPGDLFPVNGLGDHVPKLFSRNSRVAIRVETRDFGGVTVVLVGAMIVGRIGIDVLGGGLAAPGVTVLDPPCPVARGEEIGAFHLGSSVVLLCERSVGIIAPGRRVRYGESLLAAS